MLSQAPGARDGAEAQLQDAEPEGKRLVAVALSRRLADAAAAGDSALVSRAAAALSSVGPQAVTGAADALEERDLAFEEELSEGRQARDTGKEDPPAIPFRPEEVAARVKAFKDKDEAVVVELAAALALIGAPAVGPLLEQASIAARPGKPPLKRPAALMRAVATQALSSIGEPAVLELAKALKRPALRDAALRSMARAGPAGVRLLIRALEAGSGEIRAGAAAALREALASRSLPAVDGEILLTEVRAALARFARKE